MDISFIIPVYNKKTCDLQRCLNSISLSKEIKYEIIIIDDGSDSNLSQGYKKIAQKYSAKYFYQKNTGVGSARNRGIKEATGKYVYFLDADDAILKNSIKKADVKNNEDIIIFDFKLFFTDGSPAQVVGLKSYKNLSKKDEFLMQFIKDGIMNWACGKLIKNSFVKFNNLKFNTSLKSGEDFDFVYKMISLNPSIRYVKKITYLYYYDKNTSKTRALSDPIQRIDDILALYNSRIKVVQGLSWSDTFREENIIKSDALKAVFNVYETLVENNSTKDINKLMPKFKKSLEVYTVNLSKNKLITVQEYLLKNNSICLTKVYIILKKMYRSIKPFKL